MACELFGPAEGTPPSTRERLRERRGEPVPVLAYASGTYTACGKNGVCGTVEVDK
jgi:hypothetical protein